MVPLKFHVQLKQNLIFSELSLSFSHPRADDADADDDNIILKHFIESIEIAIELITTLPIEWSKLHNCTVILFFKATRFGFDISISIEK